MMKKQFMLVIVGISLLGGLQAANECLVEAESFAQHGGWTLTSQYMDQMGSPYLQAHGVGHPVSDAKTTIALPKRGTYHVWVRTYNWTSPWSDKRGAGQFRVAINGDFIGDTIGCIGTQWEWQYVGKYRARQSVVEVALHDLTGLDGRCDAIYFTSSKNPDLTDMSALRERLNPAIVKEQGSFDFIVVGGGLAGMCAAVAAARLGMKVALIHDRAVLGGNNSSEVRVHTSGAACQEPYPNLGLMIREFGHLKMGNGENDGRLYCDSLKLAFILAEPNVTLFLNEHVNDVVMDGDKVQSVTSQNVRTGVLSIYSAPLFADCTGDGNLGFLAGAEYRLGRESKALTGERSAVEIGDNMVMGASVLWNTVKRPNTFPDFDYGMGFTDESVRPKKNGEWQWETGMLLDQVNDAEYIRDYGMLVAYSNWAYLTHHYKDKGNFLQRDLNWVSSVEGKRESRRLMGDYVLTQTDVEEHRVYEDASVTTTWPIDLHYPDTNNSRFFPGREFMSYCVQDRIDYYPIPYRCFYSKNVTNLFMAGRDISVTHAALGTIRVMRTTAMMGEVVGMAASICKKHGSLPRSVYTDFFPELKALMEVGMGKKGLPDNQNFHLGHKKGGKK